jgi:CheY-like chemotaxis protein
VEGDPAEVSTSIGGTPFVKAGTKTLPSILIVDDLPVNLSVAQGFLATHGMSADTADSGFEAIEKVMGNAEHPGIQYDIIFMDHMMPEMDGIETTKILREKGVTTSIVALTANAVAGAREMFLQSGFNGFISKPIASAELNQALFEFLPKDKIILADPSEANAVHHKAESTQPASGIHIEGVNVSKGLELNNNDEAFFLRTLDNVRKQLPTESAQLQKEYYAKDWKNFGIRSHALKSMFATIGASDLSDAGKRLEFAVKEGRIDECVKDGPLFLESIVRFEGALDAEFKSREQKGSADTQKKVSLDSFFMIKDCLGALFSALEASDSRAVRKCFAELDKIFVRLDIGRLEELIDDYDYEQAAGMVKVALEGMD